MNAAFKQDNRMGRLKTVLGNDVLVLLRFQGSDRLNGLFTYSVDALCTEVKGFKFDDLLGTHASVEMESLQQGVRWFDGIVTQVAWIGTDDRGARYRLTLRPWLWVAGKRRTQRIFHDKSVDQILQQVFQAYTGFGSPVFELRLGSYPVLEYTVQYAESDLNFVTRMLERFAISYYFKHSDGGHVMVITDEADKNDKVPGNECLYRARAGTQAQVDDKEHFWQWAPQRNLTTGAVRLMDYNFKTPTAAMEAESVGNAAYEHGQMESYEFPGDYLELGTGQDDWGGKSMAQLRVDQEQAQDVRHFAIGNCVALRSGMVFKLTGDQIDGVAQKEYVCLSITHSYEAGSYGAGDVGKQQSDEYSAQYELAPVSKPMAPRRATPVPVIHGPQTGLVVGDGEIDVDEYGRILVHFPWDLDKAYSMRCRVSQSWASKGWGGMVIPRIGMEVVVEFINGDPNFPLVTGCVYNGKNTVPYDLPDNKTRSTFKTDTHQGEGFNELRFEDKDGKEEIFIHAQKDKNTKVEDNLSERVNTNKVESVGHDKASEIGNNLLQVVDGNMDLKVGPGNVGKVTPSGVEKDPQGMPNAAKKYGKVGSNAGEGNLTINVENNKTQTIGGFHDEKVTGKKLTTVEESYTLDVTHEILIKAGDKITIQCGGSKIVMDAAGKITVNGTDGTLNMSALLKLVASMVKIN